MKKEAARIGIDETEYAKRLLENSLSTETVKNHVIPVDPTIALFRRWAKEDATDDPNELSRREAEFEAFKENMNRNRLESGGPNARKIYP